MLLSKSCFYALRAGMYVASLGQSEYVPILRISKELNISFHFLTKILQTLTENKIMISYRGPKGGVALARPARSVKLIEIVHAIDGQETFNQCIFGLPGCGVKTPCPLHGEWASSREKIKHMFEKTTLADLAEKINIFNLRITDIEPTAMSKKQRLSAARGY
jgi:Rrf2 family protein